MKRASGLFFLILLVLMGVLLMGPLFPLDPGPIPTRVSQLQSLEDIDRYLDAAESRVSGLKPELAKGVVWRDPARKSKTEYSIVYLHGFTASRREISPVMERVAERLGANVYFARLKAHGLRSGESFAHATAQDWIDDAREALEIGRRLGERVILVGLSTGATLAVHLGVENVSRSDLAALILLSPNFHPRDWRAKFISGPLGPWLARLAFGKEKSWTPDNERHAYFWTPRHSSRAVSELMNLVNYVRRLDLAVLELPVLVVYASHDKVVDVPLIEAKYEEIGSTKKVLVSLPEATRHELAGDALAPQAIDALVDQITSFLSTNLSAP